MPIRTSHADKNYLSLNSDSVVWFAGTPDEKQGELPNPIVLSEIDPNKKWDSFLKTSGRKNTYLTGIRIAQGNENAIDSNNQTAFCSFGGNFGVGGGVGDQVITTKGGSHDIDYSGIIHSDGKNAHVVIGAWSDQSLNPSYNLDYSKLIHISGKPLTFIMGRVRNPIAAIFGKSKDIYLPKGAKILVWKSLGNQIYWWAKRAYVTIFSKKASIQ